MVWADQLASHVCFEPASAERQVVCENSLQDAYQVKGCAHLLSQTFMADTRLSGGNHPGYLPNELWDLIFHYFDGQVLLTVAGVCRGFNELAIGVYLLREGISAISIQEGHLDVSCDVLVALQRLCSKPPFQRLRCTFSGDHVLQKLRLLQNIVSALPTLRELHVHLPPDVFSTWLFTPRETRQRLAALRDGLYSMCMKISGPVIVPHSQQLLKYTLQDVVGWQLPHLSARPLLDSDKSHASWGHRVETGRLDFSSVSSVVNASGELAIGSVQCARGRFAVVRHHPSRGPGLGCPEHADER